MHALAEPTQLPPDGLILTERIRACDWSRTPIGPISQWPLALQVAAEMVSASKFPCCLTWGPSLITIYNEAFHPILGRKPEAMGRPFSDVWAEAWHAISPIAERAFAGEATFIEDFPLRIERNGEEEDAAFTFCYSPVRDEHGVVVGMLDTVIETTGRVAAERRQAQALREAQELLHQTQKMEAVGQLAGGLAHDFNNLLSSITGSLDLIALRQAQDPTADISRYLEIAQAGVKRAAALTQRLLAFSRPQSLDARPIDPNLLVRGMAELITRSIGPSITLRLRLVHAPWAVRADAHQLENALLNLCINARDAMPAGGDLVIETANATLDAARARTLGAAPGPYLAVSVIDTGCGMSADTVARIFEPFYTTKATGQGTGLGLPILYRFVRESGGHVGVRSQPGAGTTVTLYLPRHADALSHADAAQALPAAPAQSEARGETVLVVDDEEAVRSLTAEILRELGYRVVEAADGPGALAQLDATPVIHLLITDLGLPGRMSGRDVAAEARQRLPALPVLFITGYGADAVSEDERGPGVDIVSKPVDFDALALRVQRLTRPDLPAAS